MFLGRTISRFPTRQWYRDSSGGIRFQNDAGTEQTLLAKYTNDAGTNQVTARTFTNDAGTKQTVR
jgi:hypothetical protein